MVHDAARQPATNTHVVVFPSGPDAWPSSRRIFATRPDAQGRFVIGNVPHGEYLVAVAVALSPNDWFNPAVLARLQGAARAVTIDKSHVELNLATETRP